MQVVRVAVGVILRGDSTFVCLRSHDKHQGGKWEFPGGKVDEGEDILNALARELKEETGIEVTVASPLTVIRHDYGDKQVELHVYCVTDFDGEPYGREGQLGKWCDIQSLSPEDYPQANADIITLLQGAGTN